jgi:hypothetical protein
MYRATKRAVRDSCSLALARPAANTTTSFDLLGWVAWRMLDFEHLLSLSHQFSDVLAETVESAGDREYDVEASTIYAAAGLSFEHAHALRVLFEAGAPNSAAALLRLQYEALLRAAWLLYGATDHRLAKATAPLTADAAQAAKNLRSAEDMLLDLERALQATPSLRGLVLPLREIRDVSWQAMNSFVHAGLHPLTRGQSGFPTQLAADLVKNSNGMLHMAARLLARLTGSWEVTTAVEHSYLRFQDCLPVITSSKTR